ncbi:MAG: hypothetical protein O6939_09500 [Bacteroidetes bacterium]|nr:hypothetical protein [Bacteroidota bacterium]
MAREKLMRNTPHTIEINLEDFPKDTEGEPLVEEILIRTPNTEIHICLIFEQSFIEPIQEEHEHD